MRDAKARKAIGRAAASINTVLDRMVADLPERTARFSEPWLFRRVVEDSVDGRPQVVRMHDEQIAAIDAWIAMQIEEIGRPEAIRRLVEMGLKKEK